MRCRLAVLAGMVAIVVAVTALIEGAAQSTSNAKIPVKWGDPDPPPALRIKPVTNWTVEYQKALGPDPSAGNANARPAWCDAECGRVNSYLATVGANHIELWKAYSAFQRQMLSKHIIPLRHKELLTLRTAYLINGDFIWNSHTTPSRGIIAPAEIPRIIEGPDAKGWTAHEAALLRAADELHRSQLIKDATWQTLKQTYNDAEMLEVVFEVGLYHVLGMYQKSVGIPLREGARMVPR